MRAVKLYDHVQFNKIRFKTISLKFSANYQKGDESQSFGGTIRIKKDSFIWVSIVPALGIEAARIFITHDSIKYINRIKSTYFKGNFNFLRKMLNLEVDFDLLQSLLTNELFIYSRTPDDEETVRGFKSQIDSSLYVIQSLKERKINRKIKKNKTNDLIFQEIYIIPEIFKITRININDFEFQKSLDLKYSNFNTFEEQLFPQNIDCKILDKKTTIDVSIEYNKVTINKELEYPFTIPEKYTKSAD